MLQKKATIREPKLLDQEEFIEAVVRSQVIHKPWTNAPTNTETFRDYINNYQQNNQKSFLVCNKAGNITGVFNVSEIVRGYFQSAYLGFFVILDYAKQGYMSAGLKLVLEKVFVELKLHRIEANIQPNNIDSINLVRNNGFKKEGYSPRYLKIDGEWRDHERWAITYEDWLININET